MRLSCSPITRAVLAALAALALSCVLAAPVRAACPSASALPGEGEKQEIVRATLCLLNDQRAKQDKPPLRLNAKLGKAALGHARDMARRKYFSHDSPSGETFVDRIRHTGYLDGNRSWTIGENIAWATGDRASPRQIVRSWMHSAGHRANILSSSFHEIGIGIAQDVPLPDIGPGGTYATDFGFRG